MPMKQSDILQMYRDELRRSKRWRYNENYEDDWKRYIDLYRGKQYSGQPLHDQLMVNLVFSTINTIAPAVAVNNPKFVVNARNPNVADRAVIAEEVLNYLWQVNRYQKEFRLAVNDNLVIGHGWVKVGYKFSKPPEEKPTGVDNGDPEQGADFGIDDRDPVDGNVETELVYTYDDRPFVERISPFDMFVDPDARHPKEMRWIAQRTWRPVQDVNVDSRYSPTARKRVSAKSWSRWSSNEGDQDGRDDKPDKGPLSYCEIIEFYDCKRNTVCTFCLDSDVVGEDESGFLIRPKPMPYALGQPFEMLRNYEVADYFYPIGDVQQIESLQIELNQTRTQMMNHRKRFSRKWIYNQDAFDQDGVAALESDVDNTMIPTIADDLQQAVVPMPAVITPTDFYDQSGIITNDIDRVSGVTDYQRGASQTNIKRTATEAAMIQDASNARAQDRLAKIEDVLSNIGERIIGLMQQFMSGEQVARIVTMPGRAWVPYDAEYIQGEFDFDVAAGSTEPMNETFRRQSALQLVDASMPFLQLGVANPAGLYMQVLQKGFGIKDVSQLVVQEQPGAPDMGTAQPQEVPPGGEQPGLPPGVPAPGPQGQAAPPPVPNLEGPEVPQPGSDIPPEMLMAMLGSNGPATGI
jgi:Phage portal protein, SPP1 Gp6-like